jgi:hypothetical protein
MGMPTLSPFGYARAIGSRDLGGTDALPKLHGRKRGNEALLRPVRRGSADRLLNLWLRERDSREVLRRLRQADRGGRYSRASGCVRARSLVASAGSSR